MSLLFLDPCVAYKPAILSFDPSSTMDASLYKDFTVSRGLNYHYYHSAPQDGKPVLFLLHGFPSTSKDWREQVAFFKNEGYGLIVPDMIGYSGTASPKDPNDYRVSLIVKDLADILDAEKVDKAIVIGHDWGAKIAGRFANYYPDRSIATIFLAVGYQPPSTDNTYEQFLEMSKKMFGYELFGYWRFFSEPDGPKLVEDHIDSFLSLLYAKDRTLGSVHFSPLGALRAWLSEDKTTPTAGYISAEEIELHKQDLLKAGFEGPSCYYKIHTLGIDAEDNKGVPPQNVKLVQPTFFGGCKNDQVARADLQKPIMEAYCPNLTYREFEAGHWVLWEAKDAVNEELLKWIQAL